MIGDVLNALQTHGKPVKRNREGYVACCPAHDDSEPSLSVSEGNDGKVLLKCFAGCELDAVLAALDLDREAVRPVREDVTDKDLWTPHGPAADIYRYTDEAGELLFQVVRCQGKRFLQRRPDASKPSGWDWSLGDVRRPLYRLPRVLKAIGEGLPVFVVEGEKDVRALELAGEAATCNPGGALKWRPEHTKTLTDAEVVIVADRDDTGRRHAREVAEALTGVARSVIRVEPAQGKDAFDHLAAGLSVDDFLVVSESEEVVDRAEHRCEFLAQVDSYDWLVPGLLEHGDRLMLTGFEGRGKSQLLWQIGMCVAAGIHPLSFGDIPSCRVLLIDCENSSRHLRRRLRALHDRTVQRGRPVDPKQMHVLVRGQGLDLTREDDASWLHERVIAHKPELLILGPLYRLHAKDPNDEMAARATAMAVDKARAAADCVVILEAHSGHAREDGLRNLRPTGSSLWLRWPEFGYGLQPTDSAKVFKFKNWRGSRDERAWPDELHHGTVWPWEGKWDRAQEEGLF